MSVPAVVGHGGWQSRRVGRLSASASAYAAVVALAALVAAAVAVAGDTSTQHEWLAFAILLPLAATAPLFRVPVGRNHSLHAAPAFVVAGALVLPPLLVVALVIALHAPLAIRDRYPWYIQAFNIANFTLSGLAAWLAVELIGQTSGLGFALSGLIAAGVFVIVNHVLLAVMLRLGRGHSFRETGLLSASGLGIEFVIASLGVAVAEFVTVNPWLVPIVLAPLALAHRSLSTTAQLRETEERFRTMFEAAPTATLLFGVGGEIMTANRSALSLLGYEHDEALLTHADVIRHPDDAEEGRRLYAELIRGDRDSYRREARFMTKDGRTIVTQLAIALVRDADGKPDFAIGMAEDVTERKLLEEQLRQSQKLEAIGRLAGGVAHDFNNMLTAIGGYTAFALEHAEDGSPLQSDLDEIRKATDRAALLTRQLLAFSRKQVLTPELLNLNGIVVEMQTMLRPLIGEDIVLTTHLDPALGPIEADPGQLHQVVMNLVVNARDAMPNGGMLTIETANADVDEIGDGSIEPGRYITLTVRDAGERDRRGHARARSSSRSSRPRWRPRAPGSAWQPCTGSSSRAVAMSRSRARSASARRSGSTSAAWTMRGSIVQSRRHSLPSPSTARPTPRSGCWSSRTRRSFEASCGRCWWDRAMRCWLPRTARRRSTAPRGTQSTCCSRISRCRMSADVKSPSGCAKHSPI